MDPKHNPFLLVEPDNEANGTRPETVEEIRAALQAKRKPTEREQIEERDTVDFRPIHRPPLAMLCLLDDGKQDGEWIRLRQPITILGRAEGDIVIAHDTEMSGRHLAIARVVEKERLRWYLTDLESRNGSFVRVSKTGIRSGSEILIGGKRFRFEAAGNPGGIAGGADSPQETRAWEQIKATDLMPSLVEITPRGDGERRFLKTDEIWIGRDSSCQIVLDRDLLVSPRHARIYRDAKGSWHIENAGSRNGTWLRFNKLPIDSIGVFQIGEQRCILKVAT